MIHTDCIPVSCVLSIFSIQSEFLFKPAGDDEEQGDDDDEEGEDEMVMKKPAAAQIVAAHQGDASSGQDGNENASNEEADEAEYEGSEECEDDEVDEDEPEITNDAGDDDDEWKNWEGVDEEYGGWFEHQCSSFHVHTQRMFAPYMTGPDFQESAEPSSSARQSASGVCMLHRCIRNTWACLLDEQSVVP